MSDQIDEFDPKWYPRSRLEGERSQSQPDPVAEDPFALPPTDEDASSMIPRVEGEDTRLPPGIRLRSSSPQEGPRLPMSPRPLEGEPRPVAALVGRASMRRASPIPDDRALALARQSFTSSSTYFDSSHRNRVLDAMARFNSQHPRGSKYWTPAFEKRSKLFRPKTRSTVRKREAAAAISLFGSSNIVAIKATGGSAKSAQAARLQEALLNHRLQEDDRWYKFVVGGVQDADRQGFAIARTYWDYEEADRYYEEIHSELDTVTRVDTVALRDRPGFKLIPIERFHFSPAADWMNVVETSPYIIEEIPMFLCDVRRYQHNPNAMLRYRDLSDGELMGGGTHGVWDSIQMQRERDVQSRYQRNGEANDYAVVWVHRNIIKVDGEDYIFDSIGTSRMLSDMIPLSHFDPRGYRPYVVGSTIFEAHNPYNEGAVDLMAQLQDEINDTANLRQDANKMASAGRMFIKRGTGLDLHALAKFSPGQTVEVDAPDKDVKWDRSPEAPRGAFEENQLLSTELDDLIGNFSQASVANNRNLNETVGGMQILGDSANQMTEYDLHTYTKTFVAPVLQQIIDLEKQWETDQNLAAMIGEKEASSQRQFWEALDTPTKVIVDVGFGATNPQKRVERIGMGLTMLGQFFPQLMMQADSTEIARDVFAAVGQPDISRYFPNMDTQGEEPDPQKRVLQQQIQQLQSLTQPQQVQLQIAQLRADTDLKKAKDQNEAALKLKLMELQLAWVELQLEKEKNEIARGQLLLQREKLSNDITMQRMEFALQQATAEAALNPPAVGQPNEPKAAELNAPGSGSATKDEGFGQVADTASNYVKQAAKESGA